MSGRKDEPHEKKAIRAGSDAANKFNLSDGEQEFVFRIFQELMFEYETFYENSENESKTWTPSSILGEFKKVLEREKIQKQIEPPEQNP